MKSKNWNLLVLCGTAFFLVAIAIITIIIDPFLHYHGPLLGLQYPLNNERYQNDGISRNFEYDALITGTSMTQNFKPSEMDALFDCKTIKLSYSGASYKEINDGVVRAISYNPDLKYVVRSLDAHFLNYDANQNEYHNYPEYLYDNNPFNDVYYLFNKDVVPKTIAVINYTRAGNLTPTFDAYSNWNHYKAFGETAVLQTVVIPEASAEALVLTDDDYARIQENLQKNVIDTALKHPEIDFYVFYPPYSIYFYKSFLDANQWDAQVEKERYATKLLLSAENIHIFGFATNTELCTDLDNYTDTLHYGEWVNSYILECMHSGEYQLTKDNYNQYFDTIYTLYKNYDYSTIPMP